MSFTFNWPRFSDQFHYDAIQMLNTALNKGNKPPIIADKIEVVELEMGTQPPELEIRDIGDLTVDQFRGIFRLTYAGDAHLVLKTKVQANPLNHKQPDIHLMAGSRGMLAAKHPLVVPMLLRLSHFRLSSYVVLVVSKQKGITLVFKTDPLQHVDINSTFDSIAVIQNFIQREIEGQLRQMFREDLPGIIHRLSQQWVKAKVEAPYLSTTTTRPPLARKSSSNSINSHRPRPSPSSSGITTPSPPPHKFHSPPEPSSSSHPDLENFDPTYGLRPEGLPTKSVFKSFSSLFTPNKGLADLAEEADDDVSADLNSDLGDEYDDEDHPESYDFVDWGDDSAHHESGNATATSTPPEYETIPAVGGGTITRPRVLHSQSQAGLSRSISSLSGNIPLPPRSQSHLGLPPLSAGSVHSASHPNMHHHLSSSAATTAGVPLRTAPIPGPYAQRPYVRRSLTPDSIDSVPSTSRSSSGPSVSASASRQAAAFAYKRQSYASTTTSELPDDRETPIFMRRPPGERRMSVTSDTTAFSGVSYRTATTASGHNRGYDYEYERESSRDYAESLVYAEQYQRNRDERAQNGRHPVASSSRARSPNPDFSNSVSSPSPPPKYPQNHPHHHHVHQHPRAHRIVLRPSSGSSSIHQLSTLSTSNHTLSPYTRDLSHFTVRSVPPRSGSFGGGLGPGIGIGVGVSIGVGRGGKGAMAGGTGPGQGQHVKAKRKRTYKLGGKGAGKGAANGPTTEARPSLSHARGSGGPHGEDEFDMSDMDRYFTDDLNLQTKLPSPSPS